MQRTLIAVFDRHSDAQSAIDALLSSGFSRPHIRLTAGDPTATPYKGTPQTLTDLGGGSTFHNTRVRIQPAEG